VAKPNYSFEKRQRELAKKRKKEDKAARKATPGSPNEPDAGGVADAPDEVAPSAAPAPGGTGQP
jgi:hypothetical protein